VKHGSQESSYSHTAVTDDICCQRVLYFDRFYVYNAPSARPTATVESWCVVNLSHSLFPPSSHHQQNITMDAFLRTYERGVAKLGRTKKKVKDTFGLHAPTSASVPRDSLLGDSAHSASQSSTPPASTDETAVRRDAISRGITSPLSTVHQLTSQLHVESLGLGTEISNQQSPSDATKCE
jgi:hypothetical protein